MIPALETGLRGLRAPAAALLLLAACSTTSASEGGRSAATAFVDVAVVDVVSGVSRPGQTVLVQDGAITRVDQAALVRVPRGARRIDGRGKTLIPGLWDMHTHLAELGDCTLPVLVTYGVTDVRDMGGDATTLSAWRSAVIEGRLVGPDIRMASPPVESLAWLEWVARINKKTWQEVIGAARTPVGTPEDAVGAVRRIKATGVDLIKLRNLGGESYRALLREAQAQGLPVAGHAPGQGAMSVDPLDPAKADLIGTAGRGMASIEHVETVTMQMRELEPARRRTVFEAMRRNGTMLTVNLIAPRTRLIDRETLRRAIEDDGAREPDVSPALRANWKKHFELVDPNPTFDWKAHLARVDDDGRIARAAGVEMLVGTDLGVETLVPGRSVHEEMAAMVETLKMSPAEVLRAATYSPARFFRMEGSLGMIAPGRAARLVLLDRDPLRDIGATRAIAGVMLDGRFFDAVALEALRAATRRTMQTGGRCETIPRARRSERV